MPPVTRTNVDASTGHDGYEPRPNTPNGSSDIIINGQGVVRVTDAWPPHTDGSSTHSGNQSTGSATVFADGLAVARIGAAISDGDYCAAGSSDVICG